MTHPSSPAPSRRHFIRGLLGAAAMGTELGNHLAAAEPKAGAAREQADFSVIVLGDTHFDRLAHHDMDWLKREKPADVRQVENYSRITEQVLPGLVREVRETVARPSGRVPFVLHLGDLVEGLCGRENLARRHCEEALELFSAKALGAPLVLTKGNHDITGPGADRAFDQILAPATAHPDAEHRQGANSVIRHRGWWFVVFDAYRPDSLEWLGRAVADHRPDHAPMIFVIHPPVVPYSARCWHVMNRPAQADRRQRLLNLLAAHRAVVLNGHLHLFGLLRRTIGQAHIDQLSLSSVIPGVDAAPRQQRSGPKDYGPSLTDTEPRFSPDTIEQRRQTLAAEQSSVTRFEYADAPGYAILHFAGSRVTADVYQGLGRRLWRTEQVTANP
jgi:hypothetical protein